MPKGDLYRILGVSSGAAPGEIKRAYREIAFSAHPDVGAHPDAERFREAHDAYEVLSDPARRRCYDIEIAKPRESVRPEPLREQPQAIVADAFGNNQPTGKEAPEQLARYAFGRGEAIHGRRRLGMEVILDLDEARFGCHVPFILQTCITCPTCEGAANLGEFCPICYAGGVVEVEREVTLKIAPGVRDGDTFELFLGAIGNENLLLEVRVSIT